MHSSPGCATMAPLFPPKKNGLGKHCDERLAQKENSMKSKIAPGTSERLPWQILLFSLPLMASNVLQVLFNMADIAVIGRNAVYRYSHRCRRRHQRPRRPVLRRQRSTGAAKDCPFLGHHLSDLRHSAADFRLLRLPAAAAAAEHQAGAAGQGHAIHADLLLRYARPRPV